MHMWVYIHIFQIPYEYQSKIKQYKKLYPSISAFLLERILQSCLLSPCLINLYEEHIMSNARLNELQAGIKTAGRNINNLWYADDTILMAESKEELKNILIRVKEESEKAGLKLNIKKKERNKEKTKIMAHSPITSWQIEREKTKAVTNFLFLGSKITEWWLQPWNQKTIPSWWESYDKPTLC